MCVDRPFLAGLAIQILIINSLTKPSKQKKKAPTDPAEASMYGIHPFLALDDLRTVRKLDLELRFVHAHILLQVRQKNRGRIVILLDHL